MSNQTQSQLTAIKKTFMKMVESDKSLTEKLKILLKEQGISIASIVTAVRILILTIVLAGTRGGSAGGA